MTLPKRLRYHITRQSSCCAPVEEVCTDDVANRSSSARKDAGTCVLPSSTDKAIDISLALLEHHALFSLASGYLNQLARPSSLMVVSCPLKSRAQFYRLLARAKSSNTPQVTTFVLKLILFLGRLVNRVAGLRRVNHVTIHLIFEALDRNLTPLAMMGRTNSNLVHLSMSGQKRRAHASVQGEVAVKRNRLLRSSNEFLTAWFIAHKEHPYPTPSERQGIAHECDLTEVQVRNWFSNMRKRHWKNSSKNQTPKNMLDILLRSS